MAGWKIRVIEAFDHSGASWGSPETGPSLDLAGYHLWGVEIDLANTGGADDWDIGIQIEHPSGSWVVPKGTENDLLGLVSTTENVSTRQFLYINNGVGQKAPWLIPGNIRGRATVNGVPNGFTALRFNFLIADFLP